MRKWLVLAVLFLLCACNGASARTAPTVIAQATNDAGVTATTQPIGSEGASVDQTPTWSPYPAYTCGFKLIEKETSEKGFVAQWDGDVLRYLPPKNVLDTCTVVSYELPPNGKFEVTKNDCQHHHDAERTGKGDLLPLTTETTFETESQMEWGVFVCPEDSEGFEIRQITER